MKNPKTDITYKKTPDDSKPRFNYFSTCLSKFKPGQNLKLNRIDTIVIPGYIGCDLGGGDWNLYKNEITEFARTISCVRPDINIKVIYLNHPNKKTSRLS